MQKPLLLKNIYYFATTFENPITFEIGETLLSRLVRHASIVWGIHKCMGEGQLLQIRPNVK